MLNDLSQHQTYNENSSPKEPRPKCALLSPDTKQRARTHRTEGLDSEQLHLHKAPRPSKTVGQYKKNSLEGNNGDLLG